MKLFNYQLKGITHLSQPGYKALYLADDPGLGKTIQAIEAAKALNAESLLVVCPASIVNQWQEQLGAFTTAVVVSFDSFSASGPKRVQPGGSPDSKTVASRKLTALNLRRTLRRDWDVIIVDEAHAIKERGALRTKYLLHGEYGIIHRGKRIMLLSGTPVLNRPAELYPILRACYPEALFDCPNFQVYALKFCDAQPGFRGREDTNGASNLAELSSRLKGFMLRREKAVLGDTLPPIRFIPSKVDILDIIDNQLPVATRRRLTGESKLKLLADDIQEKQRLHGKMVVFFYHKPVLAQLKKLYPWAPVIQGGLTGHCKANEIKRFSYNNNHSIILVQLIAGGVGLDGLQHAASVAYVAELDWTPALIEQAVSRLHRIGQKKEVIVYFPVGQKNGLDGRLEELLAKKRKTISGIMALITDVECLIERGITMDTDLTPYLERIACALESLVGIGAPETKTRAKKAKPVEVVDALDIVDDQPPIEPDMALQEARVGIGQLMNQDPALKAERQKAYLESLASLGLSSMDGAEAKGVVRQAYNAGVAAMNAIMAAGVDLI